MSPASDSPLEWLIVGGGIHGTLLSHWLACKGRERAATVRVLDPHEEPLAAWRACTANVGMQHLRSPSVHGLDVSPSALAEFAQTAPARPLASWQGRYGRPALALFDAHCRHLIECGRLDALRVRGRARALAPSRSGWRVETDAGALTARRVVLAIGIGEQPVWPAWATALRDAGARVDHVFGAGFSRRQVGDGERVAVVGGGISAAQLALALRAERTGDIVLVMRHPLRVSDFDSDPGWLGPRLLDRFWRERDPAKRRKAIGSARRRGSMTREIASALRACAACGEIELLHGEVASATTTTAGALCLEIAGAPREVDRVLLATGFDSARPGGAWIAAAIETHGLPIAPCGYPMLRPSLAWSHGLYAMGPLAELEIGPVSRNIAGARMAAERLLQAA